VTGSNIIHLPSAIFHHPDSCSFKEKSELTVNKLTIIIVELPAFILKLETIVIRVIRAIRVRNKTNMSLSSF